MKTNKIITRFNNVEQKGDGEYMACCPAHDDKTPSLSIRYMKDERRTCIHCFAGCDAKDVLDKVGLKIKDLYEEQKGKKIMNEIRYSYHDEKGNLVYTRIRKEYDDGYKTRKLLSFLIMMKLA